ncbi:MAG: hypothetical protein DMG07_08855 [Acidobacteria bacterium]|nr:MAG: hypothetical protein DMG07_08855 [Acidobacteriota bacterium]
MQSRLSTLVYRICLALPSLALLASARLDAPAKKIVVYAGAQVPPEVGEAVFFAFDDHAIPFRRNLALTLATPEKHPANPVLRRGDAGKPDATWATWGTVLRIAGKFRMWYSAVGTRAELEKNMVRLAYAESDDGVHWTKPSLGQVEYGGSKQNNLIDLETTVEAPAVLYEPEANDASQRYKMVYISHKPGKFGSPRTTLRSASISLSPARSIGSMASITRPASRRSFGCPTAVAAGVSSGSSTPPTSARGPRPMP